MKRNLTVLLVLLIAGCVTVGNVGSQPWYSQRMSEIEYAYETGAIDDETYLGMKNEVDDIRARYQESLRYRYPGSYGFYYGYPYYYYDYYSHPHRHYYYR